MTREDFIEIYKVLMGLDAAVPEMRTVLVSPFKTGRKKPEFSSLLTEALPPHSSAHHVSSNSQTLQSFPGGKVKSSIIRWVLASTVQRGDPGPGVLHGKSLSLKGVLYCLHNIGSLCCSSADLLYPRKDNKTNTSLSATEKWLKETIYHGVSGALMLFPGTTEQGLL